MRFWVACVCLHLAACGPVLLLGDAPGSKGAGPAGPDAGIADGGRIASWPSGAAGDVGAGAAVPRDGSVPYALLAVTPSDCGRCFDLVASAAGGAPPYEYQWDDGSRSPTRRVCVEGVQKRMVTVVVQDRNAVHSAPSVTQLSAEDVDAACPSETNSAHRLCIMNPSFEGTAAVNVGQNFDAVPWSTCSNDSSTSNTPDVANDALVVIGNVPKVVDGATYVALGQGEQISQALCEDVPGGSKLAFKLDVTRVDITPGDATKLFLEVWGGIAADCSQRKLLWASPQLPSTWTNYCITLQPSEFMNQLTLRSKTDVASPFPEYLAVDHLVPVDRCP